MDEWEKNETKQNRQLHKRHVLFLEDDGVKYFLPSRCRTCTPVCLRPPWIDRLPFPPDTFCQEGVDFISHGWFQTWDRGIIRVGGGGGGGRVQKKPGSSCNQNGESDLASWREGGRVERRRRRRWGWSATTEMAQRKRDPAPSSAISSGGSPVISPRAPSAASSC